MRISLRLFFILCLIVIFAVFFFFLLYQIRRNVYVPEPPRIDERIAATDSIPLQGFYFYDFNDGLYKNSSSEYYYSAPGSISIASGKTYGTVVSKPVNELGGISLSRICVSVCLMSPDSSMTVQGKLMIQITGKLGVLRQSHSIDVFSQAHHGSEWFFASGCMMCDTNSISEDDRILVYFLNTGPSRVFMDDLSLVIGEQHIAGEKSGMQCFKPLLAYPQKDAVFIPVESIPGFVSDEKVQEGFYILPGDEFVDGHFTSSETKQILVLRSGIPCFIFGVGGRPHKAFFRKLDFSGMQQEPAQRVYTAMDTDNDGYDELISLSNSKKITLCRFNRNLNNFTVLSNHTSEKTEFRPQLFAMHANHHGKEPLLLVYDKNGDALFFGFDNGKIIPKANSGEAALSVEAGDAVNIINGDFLEKNQKLFLIISGKGGTSNGKYCFINAESQGGVINIPLNPEDPLLPSYMYGVADLTDEGKDGVVFLENQWRNRLMLAVFNSEGTYCLSKINLSGFPKHRNPLFYEAPLLFCGKYIPGLGSQLCIIARNRENNREQAELSPYIAFYYFPSDKK